MRLRLLIVQLIRKNPVVRRLYYRARLSRATSEADECAILARLAQNATPTFIEFGFEPVQFNCVALAKHPAWQGLLIDGGKDIVEDARLLWPYRIRVEYASCRSTIWTWSATSSRRSACCRSMSTGNDYWILKALIDLAPDMISVEYRAATGHDNLRPRIRSDAERPEGLVSRRLPDGANKALRGARLWPCRRLEWKLQRVLHQGRQSQAGRRVQAQAIAREAIGNPSCGAVGFCEGHAVRVGPSAPQDTGVARHKIKRQTKSANWTGARIGTSCAGKPPFRRIC